MAKLGGDRGLAQEAPPEALVVRELEGKDLQRGGPAGRLALDQVDRAARPLADELEHAVAGEDRSDGQLPAHGAQGSPRCTRRG